MRRTQSLLSAISILLIVSLAEANCTLVQKSGMQVGHNVTTVTAILTGVGAGHLVTLCSGDDHSSGLSAATDNNSNTITTSASLQISNATGGDARCDFIQNSKSGNTTFTFHQTSSTSDIFGEAREYSGCATSSTLDASGTTASTTCSVSTTATTTQANEVVVAFLLDSPNSRTLTVGAGYGNFSTTTGSNGDAAAAEDKNITSTGVQTATCGGNSGDTMSQIIGTFKAATVTSTCSIALIGAGPC